MRVLHVSAEREGVHAAAAAEIQYYYVQVHELLVVLAQGYFGFQHGGTNLNLPTLEEILRRNLSLSLIGAVIVKFSISV